MKHYKIIEKIEDKVVALQILQDCGASKKYLDLCRESDEDFIFSICKQNNLKYLKFKNYYTSLMEGRRAYYIKRI